MTIYRRYAKSATNPPRRAPAFCSSEFSAAARPHPARAGTKRKIAASEFEVIETGRDQMMNENFGAFKSMHVNPCLTCGACCAHYRVSFYWAETDAGSDNGVPAVMTDQVNDFLAAMKGAHTSSCRCTALQGVTGESVSCSIYERRASTCREFAPSWENGIHNMRCDQARLAWGLSPLRPESWIDPNHFPKAA